MDTYAVELNSFVDTILTKVYDLGAGRDIIFSSFNPDVCLLLSFKQPSIPVLFLTDAGASPVGDIRASSLQEAVRFASRWNLLGIVSQAEPLVLCPRLVRIVKESGLVCVSYGALNNEGVNVDVSYTPFLFMTRTLTNIPRCSTKSRKVLMQLSSILFSASPMVSFNARIRVNLPQVPRRTLLLSATRLQTRPRVLFKCLFSVVRSKAMLTTRAMLLVFLKSCHVLASCITYIVASYVYSHIWLVPASTANRHYKVDT